jgi:CHAD domain-containing protein
MRVATRRLRSALATYRQLFDAQRTEPVRQELAWLGTALGKPRDAESCMTGCAPTSPSLPTS